MTNKYLDQVTFRGSKDDDVPGSQTLYGAAAGDDWTQNTGEQFRIRFVIAEETSKALNNQNITFQYNYDSGGWEPISGASSYVQVATSSHYTDEDADNVQRVGSGTFTGGVLDDSGDAGGAVVDFAGNDEWEFETCLTLVYDDVVDAKTLQIRCLVEGAACDNYTDTPTLTVNKIIEHPDVSEIDGLTVGDSATVALIIPDLVETDGVTVGDTLTDIEVVVPPPDLGTILIDGGAGVGSYSEMPSRSAEGIDEGIAAADGAWINNTADTDGFAFYQWNSMPANFGSMDQLYVEVRYKGDGLGDDTHGIRVQMFESDESTPLTDNLTIDADITNSAYENSGPIELQGVVAGTKAKWDGAVVCIYHDNTTVTTPDGGYVSTDTLELTGTYNLSGATPEIDETDGLTVGDTLSAELDDLKATESDGLTVGDTLTDIAVVTGPQSVTETDGITLGDTLSALLEAHVAETDGLTVGDTLAAELDDLEASESDGLIVGDALTDIALVTGPISADETDGITVADSLAALLEAHVTETDGLTVGDVASAELDDLEVLETDGLSIGDIATASRVSPDEPNVNETDAITLGDTLVAELSDATVSETDGIAVGESHTETLVGFVIETDGLTVGDTAAANLEAYISESDALTVGDTLTPALAHQVSETDGVTVGDVLSVEAGNLEIIESDNLTVGETHDQVMVAGDVLLVDVTDAVATGELYPVALADMTIGVTDVITATDLVTAMLFWVATRRYTKRSMRYDKLNRLGLPAKRYDKHRGRR
jgi:hypothetical protein